MNLRILFLLLLALSLRVYAQSADLIIQKTGPNQVYVGAPMSYTFTIINSGPNNVSGATWNDNLPANVSNVSFGTCNATGGAICPSSYTLNNSNFSGTLPFLPVGGQIVMTIHLNAPNPAPSGSSFSNTASVSVPSGVTEVNPSTNSSTTNTTLKKTVDIEVKKTVVGTINCDALADTLFYNVYWINHGPSVASGASLVEQVEFLNRVYSGTGNAFYIFPWQIQNVVWSASSTNTSVPTTTFSALSGNKTPDANPVVPVSNFSNPVTSWAVGDTIRLRYQLVVGSPTVTGCERNIDFDIKNTASVGYTTSNLLDTVSTNNISPVLTHISCTSPCLKGDIKVEKSLVGSISCGTLPDTLSYSVNWINQGPSTALGVSLVDVLEFTNQYVNHPNSSQHTGQNALYDFPWQILNPLWSASSTNSSLPTSPFSAGSGTSLSNPNTSTLATINTWAVGDTIKLRYQVIIQNPIITGCGRDVIFKVKNTASLNFDTANLVDTLPTNNSALVEDTLMCTTSTCPKVDIEVIKTVTGSLSCSNLPDTLNYKVYWVNHGPSFVTNADIFDQLEFKNRVYTGSGNSLYSFPWQIRNPIWSVGSSSTSMPTGVFSALSGTLTLIPNAVRITSSIPNWAVGDTIRFQYQLILSPPTITGCGRDISFDIENAASVDISKCNLIDTIKSNNQSLVTTALSCSSPCRKGDIEVLKSVVGNLSCTTMPDTLSYTVYWINHGVSVADGISIIDQVGFINRVYTGLGNATYTFPWNIQSLQWRSSSNNTSVPASNFPSISGTLNAMPYYNMLSIPIAKWAVGDTIQLNYKLIVGAPIITGCGRNISFDISNYATINLTGTTFIDTMSSNNRFTVLTPVAISSIDLAVSKSVSPNVVYGGGLLNMQLDFQNAQGSPAPVAIWRDTLPSSFTLNQSSIACTVISGGGNCGTISYNPSTRILQQVITNMPSNSLVRVNYSGTVSVPTSNTEYTRAYAFAPCIDCVLSTNFAETNYYAYHFPVNLLSFQGEWIAEDVLLSWFTESEINAAYFEVERSLDNANFSPIEQVIAQNRASSYQIRDKYAAYLENNIYYRLKMVDMDGTYEYSPIVQVSPLFEELKGILFPNPATEKVFIQGKTAQNQLKLQVVDLLGREVFSQETSTPTGFYHFSVDVSSWEKGTYLVKLSQNPQVLRLVVE